MKHIGLKSFLAVIIAGALSVSCTKDKQDQYGDDQMSYLPIGDVTVHPLGDVIPVSYTSERDWRVTIDWENSEDEDKNWISMTNNGSAGTTNLEIKVKPCIQKDRSATIKFVSGDDTTLDSFKISQDCAVLDVTDDKLDYILKWNKSESPREFQVTSNIQWTMSLDNGDDFDITSRNDGSTQGEIKKNFDLTDVKVSFEAKANNLHRSDVKAAKIIISPVRIGYDGKPADLGLTSTELETLTRTIYVTQENLIFAVEDLLGNQLDASSTYLHGFNELGYETKEAYQDEMSTVYDSEFIKEFKVILEDGYEWEDNLDEIEREGLIAVERAAGNPLPNPQYPDRQEVETTLKLTWMKPNPGNTEVERDVKFWIVDEKGNPVEGTEITVSANQKPYQFVVDYDGKSDQPEYRQVIPNIGATVSTMTLDTSGPWSLQGDLPEWMNVEPKSGFGPETISISVEEQNLNFVPNSYEDGSLLLQSELNQLNIPVNVEQKEFRFNVRYSDSTPSQGISRMDTKSYGIVVTSDGPWTLEMDAYDGDEWLEISGIDRADGGNKVVFSGQACENLEVLVRASEYKTTSTDPEDDRSKVLNFRSSLHSEDEWGTEGNHVHMLNFVQQSLRTDVLNVDRTENFQVPAEFVAYKSSKNKSDFYVNCSAPWTLHATGSDGNPADWIHFEDAGGNELIGADGKEYKAVSMVVATNKDKTVRKADVKVVVIVGSESKVIPLGSFTQDGFVYDVTWDTFSILDALNTKVIPVTINTTAEAGWTVTCDDDDGDWFGASKKSGHSNSQISFTPTDNGALDERSGDVVITSDVTGEKFIIPFKQKAYEFDNTTKTLTTFNELSSKNTAGQNVAVTCTGAWTLKDKPSWITVSPDSGNGNATLKVTTCADHTSTDEDREDSFKVVSRVGGYTHEKIVKVSQSKYTWTVEGMDDVLELDALDKGDVTVRVTSSGNWTVLLDTDDNEDGDFVSVSPTSGTGSVYASTHITITIKENFTTDPDSREAVMTVKSDQYNSSSASHLIKTMKIEQKAYVYDVSVSDMEFEAAGGSKTVRGLKCSGNLTVSSSESWVETEVSAGVLTVEVEEYTGKGSRTATVIIQSEHVAKNSKLKTTFTVTQKAAESDKK